MGIVFDKKSRRGVENVIALVILMTVVVITSIIAAKWVMSMVQTTQEKFIVQPRIYVINRTAQGSNTTQPVVTLYIKNEGNREARIIMIEIRTDVGSWINRSEIIVPANQKLTVTIDQWEWTGSEAPPVLHRGDHLRVIIYTDVYGSMFYDVVVRS